MRNGCVTLFFFALTDYFTDFADVKFFEFSRSEKNSFTVFPCYVLVVTASHVDDINLVC